MHRSYLLTLAAVLACSFDATGLGDEVGGTPAVTGTAMATTGAEQTDTSSGGSTMAETGGSGTGSGATQGSETTTPPPPACGDGTVDPGEACDGGPDNQGGLACTPECVDNTCGDGYVGLDEFCDPGPGAQEGLMCTPQCAFNVCGDGYRGAMEACDEGPNNGVGLCNGACQLAGCGDGMVGPNETCDDANTDNTDACIDTCQGATCGDGYVQMGVEICDLAGDNGKYEGECNTACSGPGPYCGDGLWEHGEELCDGGQGPKGVDCKGDCTFSCKFARGDCNLDPVDGCEADLGSDEANCSGCKKACGQGQFCVLGACI